MLEQSNLKIHVLKILQDENWIGLCNVLEQKFNQTPNEINVLQVTPETVTVLTKSLQTVREKLVEQNDIYFKTLKQIYKSLRNAVAYNPEGQILIADSETVLSDTAQILDCLKENEVGWDCLKMLLQFLINLVIENELISKKVWALFSNDLKQLLRNNICLYHSSALVYNIFHMDLHLLEENDDIIKHILDSYKQNDSNEYVTFLLELFIKNVSLNTTYISYSAENRMLCLEMMKEIMNKDKTWVTQELLDVLSEQFKKKSDCILKTVTNYLKEIEPFEVTLLLDVLAGVSSDESYVQFLQKDKSLLINCAFLLKSVHEVGRTADNNFSVIPKLSQLDNSTEQEILEHPSYGFKATIVRLLANLCWKHRNNQDLICLNRNIVIIQWVIFAIRNVCENNIENQDIIKSMNAQGVISSETLYQMGITLHSDERQTITVLPLDVNK
ncbi:ataxin-10 [Holotrichia oblita]|uniref:Ataxin-10 n=1 Tax=Holotrichia oblita TaxID=644536 RepID=A0ACB9TP98_HOLOL|nr:ataxin-10 [Holotrichia oblita]